MPPKSEPKPQPSTVRSTRDRKDKAVQKSILSNNKNRVEKVFDDFKTINDYMGVYFTDVERPFITFAKNKNDLKDVINIGRATHHLAYIYDTNQAKESQTTVFLA